MGSILSKSTDKDLAELLELFSGKEPIPITEQEIWIPMLSHSFILSSTLEEDKIIFERSKPLSNHLINNNLKTGNFGSLLLLFVGKVSFLLTSPATSPEFEKVSNEVQNCVFIIRVFLQHLVQRLPECEVIKHINVKGVPEVCQSGDSDSMVKVIINALIDLIIHVPLSNQTYYLHCEATNALLVFMSTRLFTTLSPSELQFFRLIYTNKQTDSLCKVLLHRFISQLKSPKESGGSLFVGLASGLMGLFMSTPENETSPIAIKSILLCVVLLNHSVGNENEYKECLYSLSDHLENLYNIICLKLHREETTLLLYHLIHKNPHFRLFVLNRDDIDALVCPMLKIIYNASTDSCLHIYMSLIILLILTEDTNFNRRVHGIILKNVSWFSERNLPEISLGGLIILVTSRAVQFNLLKMRDEYLHTSCLAALANMSSQFINLHSYVCQKLISLYEVLAKTYSIAQEELVAIERAMRIILEVINSCLCNQLVHNPNLIYALLHKRKIFETFKEYSAFQDIIQNVDYVLQYFLKKLDESNNTCLEVEYVLEVIKKTSPELPSQQLQKFPELRFKYVEEEKPDAFFIPYIWKLVSKYSCIYWQPSLIKQC